MTAPVSSSTTTPDLVPTVLLASELVPGMFVKGQNATTQEPWTREVLALAPVFNRAFQPVRFVDQPHTAVDIPAGHILDVDVPYAKFVELYGEPEIEDGYARALEPVTPTVVEQSRVRAPRTERAAMVDDGMSL